MNVVGLSGAAGPLVFIVTDSGVPIVQKDSGISGRILG
jgi:hypothetical protein